jgi:hypothetical protein
MDDVRFSPLAGDASRDRTIFFAINLHNAFVFIIAQKVFGKASWFRNIACRKFVAEFYVLSCAIPSLYDVVSPLFDIHK